MFMTRMELNMRKRESVLALRKPERLHSAIEDAFPGERERRLWRIDRYKDSWYLYIVSKNTPNLINVVDQFGYSGKGPLWEVKEYDGLLDSLKNGDVWAFKLVANPTKPDKSEGAKRGKRVSCKSNAEDMEWLMERADRYGFSVEENQFCVACWQWMNVKKYSEDSCYDFPFLMVQYEGILRITDRDKFRDTLVNGIGHEKAYGMGMLTLG